MEYRVDSGYTLLRKILNPVVTSQEAGMRRMSQNAALRAEKGHDMKGARMFFPTHRPPVVLFALAVAAVAVSGCGDRMLDAGPVNYVFGGAPPPDAASPVRGLSETPRPYPNLGSVPGRPTDVQTAQQTDAEMKRLAKARSDNRDAAAALKAIPGGPAPLAVPPPPKLTPGGGR
jgi:hypothetical protein